MKFEKKKNIIFFSIMIIILKITGFLVVSRLELTLDSFAKGYLCLGVSWGLIIEWYDDESENGYLPACVNKLFDSLITTTKNLYYFSSFLLLLLSCKENSKFADQRLMTDAHKHRADHRTWLIATHISTYFPMHD